MPEFQIEHEVHSLAQIFEPVEFRGYVFRLWQDGRLDPFNVEKILIEKSIQAETFSEAIVCFRTNLEDIINRLSFLSQCFMDYEHGSFSIKQSDPPLNHFFFRHIFSVSGVGLHLDKEEKTSFDAIENFSPPGDLFGFLREAINASTHTTRFTMLISALEAIAGEKIYKPGRRNTNKDFIRDEILGSEMYDYIYAYETGVRNAVLHGRSVDLTPRNGHIEDINSKVYKCIRDYLIREHGLLMNGNATGVPRNPFNNYNIWQGWLVSRAENINHDLTDLVRMSYAEFESGDDDTPRLLSLYDIYQPGGN
jgi:hypothetical protein